MLKRKLTYLIGTSQEFQTLTSEMQHSKCSIWHFVCSTILFELQKTLNNLNLINKFEDEYRFNDYRYVLSTN